MEFHNAKTARGGYPIHQYDKDNNYIKTYATVNDAGRLLNLSAQSIRHCALGYINTVGGFIWSYELNK